jgi:hypothetical protein
VQLPPIPDVASIVKNPNLHLVALNKEVTAGHRAFGSLFQAIVDPGFTGSSEAAPNWFAISPYASREAGQAMQGAQDAKNVIHAAFASGATMMPFFPLRLAGAVLKAVWDATHADFDLKSYEDPVVAAISADRVLNLVKTAPGKGLEAKFMAVANTLGNCLESGNRAIFGDLGGSAETYLKWRAQQDSVTPDKVVQDFDPPHRQDAARILSQGRAVVSGSGPIPSDVDAWLPGLAPEALLPGGFALYELAGQSRDPQQRDRAIDLANMLLAWHEQHDVAQAAFTPPSTPPGEVNRRQLMAIATPTIGLPLREHGWTYDAYLDHQPHSPLAPPPTTTHNWADFRDRWPAILDSFDDAYQEPGAMWPMPNPDPAVPLRAAAPQPLRWASVARGAQRPRLATRGSSAASAAPLLANAHLEGSAPLVNKTVSNGNIPLTKLTKGIHPGHRRR